jgi:hypothetical protein
VAAKTGVSPVDAQKRVDDAITGLKETEIKARQAADTAKRRADGCNGVGEQCAPRVVCEIPVVTAGVVGGPASGRDVSPMAR